MAVTATTSAIVALLLITCYSASVTSSVAASTSSRDWSSANGIGDPRIVTQQELLKDGSTRQFSADGVTNYSRLLVDQQNSVIYLGARDVLLRLEMQSLKLLDRVSWPANELAVSMCVDKGQSKDNCRNYIKVVEVSGDRLLVCGTYAFSPKCSWRELRHPNNVLDWVTGVSRCPYSPLHNSTSLMTSSGNLFSATVTDFSARDAALYRSLGPSKMLRTVEHDSRWLNNPNFVALYEIRDFVYVFFREVASEHLSCGKTVYARVARVCKNDVGGKYALGENWATFAKARLNCSLPGDQPFYFNEIQATYWDADKELLYGVFTTAPTSIYASAVCVFNLAAIDKAFSGPSKYQENSQMLWTRGVNTLANLECPSSDGTRARESNATTSRMASDPQKNMLMDLAAHPTTATPALVSEGERYTHIVVDTVTTPDRQHVSVMFVATLEGAIRKIVLSPKMGDSCVVETLEVVAGRSPGLIKSVQLVKKLGLLYVATETSLYQIPVQRCQKYAEKLQCIESRDPYCAWNEKSGACVSVNSESSSASLLQDLSTCPTNRQSPGDVRWLDWLPWQQCPRAEGEGCLCRKRACSSSSSLSPDAESLCLGYDVEVTNCTVHGGWTDWSDWSACSVTCGDGGRKTRRRSCTNPQPAFGGSECRGSDVEEDLCLSVPCASSGSRPPLHAAAPSVPGDTVPGGNDGWSGWSEFTECTAECGGGIQSRSRWCSSAAGCQGNSQEWRSCNVFACPEVRRVSEWTPWIATNQTSEGHIEERYRIVCRARVPDESVLRTHIKTEARYCAAGFDSGCAIPVTPVTVDVDGGWSPWSQWTECDKLCDGGWQERERHCNAPTPSGRGLACAGHSKETRSCNTHLCEGQWSCWGEFGACSATCGRGVKTRTRHCQASSSADGNFVFTQCIGGDTDQQPCLIQECDDGWLEWTQWSVCGRDKVQYRNRKCAYGQQCQGSSEEYRACRPSRNNQGQGQDVNDYPIAAESVHGASGEYQIFHLLLVGGTGFVAGVIVMCIVLYVYCYCHKRRTKRRKYATSLQHRYDDSSVLSSPVRSKDRRKTSAAPGDYIRSFSAPDGASCAHCSMEGMNRVMGSGTGMTVNEASQKQAMYGRYNTWSTRYPHLSTGGDDLDEEDSGRFTMMNSIPPARTHQRATLNMYS